MNRPYRPFVPLAAAAAIGTAASLFVVSPASAAQISTTMASTATMHSCANGCTSLGNAPQGTAARSYCALGQNDLIFSVGAANRFGFVPRSALVTQTQSTNCFNGGAATQSNGDVDVRACANQACPVISDLASADSVRQYCQRNDSAGTVWIAVFNLNGQQVGFARANQLVGAPAPGLPAC